MDKIYQDIILKYLSFCGDAFYGDTPSKINTKTNSESIVNIQDNCNNNEVSTTNKIYTDEHKMSEPAETKIYTTKEYVLSKDILNTIEYPGIPVETLQSACKQEQERVQIKYNKEVCILYMCYICAYTIPIYPPPPQLHIVGNYIVKLKRKIKYLQSNLLRQNKYIKVLRRQKSIYVEENKKQALLISIQQCHNKKTATKIPSDDNDTYAIKDFDISKKNTKNSLSPKNYFIPYD